MKKIFLILLFLPSLLIGMHNFVFISVPKCGTGFLGLILQDISGLQMTIPTCQELEKDVKSTQENDQYLFCHGISQDSIDALLKQNYKFVFIYRDPRDQMISFIFWMMKMAPNHPICKIQGIDNQITAMITAPIKHADFFDPKTAQTEINHDYWYSVCYKQIQAIPKESLYKVKFEDLIGSKGGGNDQLQLTTVLEIADFLDIPISQEQVYQILDARLGKSVTFRKGTIGDWKNYFTEEHIELYKNYYGQQLIDLGFENNDDWKG